MREKIMESILKHVTTYGPWVGGCEVAAEEIIKEMDKACCEKCGYYSDKFDKCEYHLIEITDSKTLKCNDFTEMEGK